MSWPNPEIPSAPDSEPFLFNLDDSSFKAADTLPDCLHSFLFAVSTFVVQFGFEFVLWQLLIRFANSALVGQLESLLNRIRSPMRLSNTNTGKKQTQTQRSLNSLFNVFLTEKNNYFQILSSILHTMHGSTFTLMFSQLELTLDNVLQARMLRFCQPSP